MKKNIKRLFKLAVTIAAIVGILSLIPNAKVKDISNITYEEIDTLRPNIVVGSYAFYSHQAMGKGLKLYIEMAKRAAQFKPLGVDIYGGKTFRIYINSRGGRIDVAKDAITYFKRTAASMKIKFTCYINDAMSAAFTFAMAVCDKRIGLSKINLMTHKSYINGTNTTLTKILDYDLINLEIESIGMPFADWRVFSRGKENKYYTRDEMIEYDLIHEFKDD
jgi:hypothetical protein